MPRVDLHAIGALRSPPSRRLLSQPGRQRRFSVWWIEAFFGICGTSGLALAGIGLYGLVSFLVTERTREIGVRIAVGATPGEVAKLVISDGVRWTVVGVLAGIGASAVLLRLLQGLLYEVEVLDLRVYAGAIATLATEIGRASCRERV